MTKIMSRLKQFWIKIRRWLKNLLARQRPPTRDQTLGPTKVRYESEMSVGLAVMNPEATVSIDVAGSEFGARIGSSRWFKGEPQVTERGWECPISGCRGVLEDTGRRWSTNPMGMHHKCTDCGFTAALKDTVIRASSNPESSILKTCYSCGEEPETQVVAITAPGHRHWAAVAKCGCRRDSVPSMAKRTEGLMSHEIDNALAVWLSKNKPDTSSETDRPKPC